MEIWLPCSEIPTFAHLHCFLSEKDANIIFEHVEMCRMLFYAEENLPYSGWLE